MNALPTRAAGLALAAMLTLASLVACSTDTETVADDPAPTTSSAPVETAEPTEPVESTAAPEESQTTAPDTVAAAIYFVGDSPLGPRLYREFREVETDNPLSEATALMTAGDVLDRDYYTLYPGGSFGTITVDDAAEVINVEVLDDAWNNPAPQMSRTEARLATQQLVYTVQGIAQQRYPVRVWLGEEQTTVPLFGIDTSKGLKNADQLDVLSLVNVTAPEEGATVSGTFTASGVASSFEATVPWQVRQGDTVVLDGFSTAEGWLDKLFPWESEVDVSALAPGDYTFVALTDDPSGGAEGPGPFQDSKSITVE